MGFTVRAFNVSVGLEITYFEILSFYKIGNDRVDFEVLVIFVQSFVDIFRKCTVYVK